MPIKTADEAEAIAKEYMRKKTGKTAHNMSIAKVQFDGTFFSVYGEFTQEESLFYFGVKVDKEGNVVAWYAQAPPTF